MAQLKPVATGRRFGLLQHLRDSRQRSGQASPRAASHAKRSAAESSKHFSNTSSSQHQAGPALSASLPGQQARHSWSSCCGRSQPRDRRLVAQTAPTRHHGRVVFRRTEWHGELRSCIFFLHFICMLPKKSEDNDDCAPTRRRVDVDR